MLLSSTFIVRIVTYHLVSGEWRVVRGLIYFTDLVE